MGPLMFNVLHLMMPKSPPALWLLPVREKKQQFMPCVDGTLGLGGQLPTGKQGKKPAKSAACVTTTANRYRHPFMVARGPMGQF